MRHGRAGGSRLIPRRLGTALATVLCLLLSSTGSASAATTVLQGRFACNDGGSLAGARVELLQIYTRRLPEIPPNVRVAVATHADDNGAWGFRVSGDESNWRVRAVLVNADVGVKDFGFPWHHYAETLRTQNDRPLADYGTQVVPGAECRLWRGLQGGGGRLPRGHRRRPPRPGGSRSSRTRPPRACRSRPYTDVWWPAGYSPTKDIGTGRPGSVAQHEYAHTVRHALDGDKASLLPRQRAVLVPALALRQRPARRRTTGSRSTRDGPSSGPTRSARRPCPNSTGLQHRAQRRVRAQAPGALVRRGVDPRSDGGGPGPEPRRDPLDVRLQQRPGLRAEAGHQAPRQGQAPEPGPPHPRGSASEGWARVRQVGERRGGPSALLAARRRGRAGRRRSRAAASTRRSPCAGPSPTSRAARPSAGSRGGATAPRWRSSSASSAPTSAGCARSPRGRWAGREHLQRSRATPRAPSCWADARSMAGRGRPRRAPGRRAPAPRSASERPVAGRHRCHRRAGARRPLRRSRPHRRRSRRRPAAADPDVDLVISRVYGDDATAEALCDIFADVRNAGSADAPASLTRFLSDEPGQFDELIVTPALAAGETTTVRVDRQYGQFNSAAVTADATGWWQRPTSRTTPAPAPGRRRRPAASSRRTVAAGTRELGPAGPSPRPRPRCG